MKERNSGELAFKIETMFEGDVVYREGDKAEYLYVILGDGEVSLHKKVEVRDTASLSSEMGDQSNQQTIWSKIQPYVPFSKSNKQRSQDLESLLSFSDPAVKESGQNAKINYPFAWVSSYFGDTEFMLHFGEGISSEGPGQPKRKTIKHLYTAQVDSP